MKVEKRLKELNITLPEPMEPLASFTNYVLVDDLLFISGQGPFIDGKIQYSGKVGGTRTKEEGYASARLCGINLIAQMKAAVGDLDRIEKVVHILGFVASTPDCGDQAAVMNGASDLMLEVFGEAGKHTRSALGMVALPFDITTEAELIAKVRRD